MNNCTCGSCSTKNNLFVVLKLKDFTPEKFQLWKDMQGTLNNILSDHGLLVDDIIYDEDNYTKSCTVSYETSKDFGKAIMSAEQYAISKGVIAELVSLKDNEDNIINFSMHKANKLIDEAEISIEKLQHL